MSGPMTRDQWPADLREYHDKLDAFNLAVGEWLGLDPAQVFNFDLIEGEEPEFRASGPPTNGTYTQVTWESLTEQVPRVGHYLRGGRADMEDGMVFTADVLIDRVDDRERIAVAGRKPKMFSAAEDARLRGLFSQ